MLPYIADINDVLPDIDEDGLKPLLFSFLRQTPILMN